MKCIFYALSFGFLGFSANTHAQSYPTKQITIIVGFTAGGTTDVITRLLAEKMSKAWGQPIIIENKPGAGGNIAAEMVAKSKPDGYTLLMSSGGPLSVNGSLYKNLQFDNLKDLTPITQVADVPNVFVVNPKNIQVKNIQEFFSLAKENPNKYFIASTGNGTATHLAAEALKQRMGINLTHVPYRGSGAVTDVLTGSVDCMFATTPSVIEYIKAGKLKALAIGSQKRMSSVAEVPTFEESGVSGFKSSTWFGLVGPAGMNPLITSKIQTEIAIILRDPLMSEKLIQQGAIPIASTPEEFSEFIKAETIRWAKTIKSINLVLD